MGWWKHRQNKHPYYRSFSKRSWTGILWRSCRSTKVYQRDQQPNSCYIYPRNLVKVLLLQLLLSHSSGRLTKKQHQKWWISLRLRMVVKHLKGSSISIRYEWHSCVTIPKWEFPVLRLVPYMIRRIPLLKRASPISPIKQSVNGKIVIKMSLRDFAKNTLKEMEGGFSPAIKIS